MGKRLIPTSAIAVISENHKLGRACATYAAQVTCPECCPLRGKGCYAEYGQMLFHTRQLNDDANQRQLSPLQVAGIEAAAIDALPATDRPLRLHVVGDCATDAAARIVSGAADRYTKRTGARSWTYTHGWRDVDRASWGNVSVLASCETPAETLDASRKGYAAALVVDRHPSRTTYQRETGTVIQHPGGWYTYRVDTATVIPCPQQTTPGVNCADCGLCQRSDWLKSTGRVIGFSVHGSGWKRAQTVVANKIEGNN